MSQDVYSKLAKRLDQTPNGLARTDSGVELELLAWLFDPEEARVASTMRLTPEPPGDIAARAGLSADEAADLLARMRDKGLIRGRPTDAGPVYGLMPFIVGIYEEQLPRMDSEFATL
ncbi:MAG: 4Fe-4S ferredoxin, partial [Candidatus Eisenbacteria bacterium]|nr:4Fe-4S ferredoxin [Candidatus Eisenbacteria bacterium]